ncbi:N-acetyltransferase family protein [Agaribacterium sp. ZY112]|uniref:GNAT family N-acetyltransferase n=1 Tax=Agaribacterium sp. ZY112 TaxID=3233574 RepID=UPI0035260AA2
MHSSKDINYRIAGIDDVAAIAALHALSWQQNYKDALQAEYLAEKAVEERLSLWQQRFAKPVKDQVVFIAEQSGELLGFAALFYRGSERWGAYLDNLHVKSGLQGRGIGKALLKRLAAYLLQHCPEQQLCLLVNQNNLKAQAFYRKLGAVNAEGSCWNAPDGSVVPTYWFVWQKPASILEC